jgi:hypothetical protein
MKPYVQWNHIDGPMLSCSDHQVHWLTWRERFALWLGLTTIAEIDAKIVAAAPSEEANG